MVVAFIFVALLVLRTVPITLTAPDPARSGKTSTIKRTKACPKQSKSKIVFKIDFESLDDVSTVFQVSPSDVNGHRISKSSTYHKNGDHSLLWEWPDSRPETQLKLILNLGRDKRRRKSEMRKGGIKFWMYRVTKTPISTMQITFVGTDKNDEPSISSSTNVNLNFKGWRGVWIGYQEFKTGQFNLRKLISIEFLITSDNADKIYVDLIQFVKVMGKQTRDVIVRYIGDPAKKRDSSVPPSSSSSLPNPPPAATPYYSDKDFWQQSLRWYDEGAPRSLEEVTDIENKISEIKKIENRLENWYADTAEALSSLGDQMADTSSSAGYNFRAAKKSRWETLSEDIRTAHERYDKIQFEHQRPSLFTKVSEFGDDDIKDDATAMTKFGFMFTKVLLPLSIEYNFNVRDAEIQYLSKMYCSDLLSQEVMLEQDAVQKIAGKNELMKEKFKTLINEAKTFEEDPLNCEEERDHIPSMEKVIQDFNKLRFERIKRLLELILDQGWAQGSGLGSLDHEMNKDGSGFMHSMFLLRNSLRQETELYNSLMGAMKWYNDFNEIYQEEDDYVYEGTTADRMRTILLYRLMIILIAPSNENQADKIRNMEYFKIWFKHALKVNKGLSGVVKPDFTGFHHKTFYGSAYVPHALHNAALVQYLLGGTSFALDEDSKKNLRKALEVLRITAVKYSTPNGICGRFPGYHQAILVYHVPAYAYISYVHAHGTVPEGMNGPEMFLRLFDPSFPLFDKYLKNGTIQSGIYYWNTIGSLDVLRKAKTLPCKLNPPCAKEISPVGHWSKNFATLSIHRRDDWSIAVKGFNQYTWDYESNPKENVFGVFGSHGSLQISNSESSLNAYNVENGWDWTRVPGTTTIKARLRYIKTSKARNYNYKGKFAGGVSFIGSTGEKPKNGAFGMVFEKPDYEMKRKLKNSPLYKMTFGFKKSYFFYDNLIVCIGSDIKLGNINKSKYFAQTTLFQDALLNPDTSIEIDGRNLTLETDENLFRRWKNSETVQLRDTNGNIYKVETGENILIVKIGSQLSKKSNGCDKTYGNYSVAWLKHKTTRRSVTSKKSVTLASTMENDINNFIWSKTSKAELMNDSFNNDFSGNIHEDKDGDDDDDDDEDDDMDDYEDESDFAEIETSDSDHTADTDDPNKTYSYKYAILLSGGNTEMLNKYTVIKQDDNVHAIKLSQLPGLSNNIYGYSFFRNTEQVPLSDGPIKSVSTSCMIMAESGSRILYLAISDPSLKFGFDPSMKTKETCTTTERNEPTQLFSPKNSNDIGTKMLYCVEAKPSEITVTLNVRVQSIRTPVIVDSQSSNRNPLPELEDVDGDGSRLIFSNLANGFTTEVKLNLA